MRLRMLKIFVAILLICSQPLLAQDLYRCGNTYQDTPCKGGASKPINEKPPKKPAFTITPISPEKKTVAAKEPATTNEAECKKRGESAKVITKLRELGVSASDQIAIAADDAQKALIKDIYSRSGSSFQIQKAIERECLQQKQKATLTDNWMTRTKRLLGFGAAPAKSSAKSNAKPQPTTIAKAVPKPVPTQVKSTADPKPVVEPATAPTIQPMPIAQPQPTHTEPLQQATPAVVPASQPEPAPANPPTTTAQAPEEQEDTQGICSSLKAGVENLTNQIHSRKWAAEALNELKQQQLRLESTMKAAGC